MTDSKELSPSTQTVRKACSIKVIGVGGAGCNAVRHLVRDAFEGVSFAVMSTDVRLLAQSPVTIQLNLGGKTMHGLGTGGDPDRGRLAAEEDAAGIRAICEGADVVFVVAGLGGGTGTGAAPVVARVAKEAGALVLAIVMLPFTCEGNRRQRQAQGGLQALKTAADGVICLPNQKIFKLIDEKTSLLEALEIANDFVAQGVRGIWRLLSRPGLINVDFADLCAVTRGRHSENSLAMAEARGENRAREAVERLLAHPLIEGGQALTEAAEVLVSIAGGPGLTLAEVNRVMEQINRQAEQAQIIMGAAIEEDLGNRLLITLVASRRYVEAYEDRSAAKGRSVPDLAPEWEEEPLEATPSSRNVSPYAAPPPALSPARAGQILAQQVGGNARQRKKTSKMLQAQLPLDIVSKGRFAKSQPTIHQGEDLDIPTYIRRGVALN